MGDVFFAPLIALKVSFCAAEITPRHNFLVHVLRPHLSTTPIYNVDNCISFFVASFEGSIIAGYPGASRDPTTFITSCLVRVSRAQTAPSHSSQQRRKESTTFI